ncbi:hypothetical protein LXL04_004018 [Taraxacum kok-saghyz]
MDHVRDNSDNLHEVRMSHSEETKLHLLIANLEHKNTKMKEELMVLDLKMTEKNEEIAHLKAQNFELNDWLMKIAKAKEKSDS